MKKYTVAKISNSHCVVIHWAVLGAIFAMVALSCNSQDGVTSMNPTSPQNLIGEPSPTSTTGSIQVQSILPDSKPNFSIIDSYYATPVPSGDIFDSSNLYSIPVDDPGIIPTPFPITREWIESGINLMSDSVAYEFDEIYYPDYATFPLDIPSQRMYLSRCRSKYISDDTIAMWCEANNKNSSGVYNVMYIFVTVNVWDGSNESNILFLTIGEPIDWASLQFCEITYHIDIAQSLSSLSCYEPSFGSRYGVLHHTRNIIDEWYDRYGWRNR